MGKYMFLIETLNKLLQQPASALDATEAGMLITVLIIIRGVTNQGHEINDT